MDGRISVNVMVVEILDYVSTLTSKTAFLYLYCVATSPVENPHFFTTVDVSATPASLQVETVNL